MGERKHRKPPQAPPAEKKKGPIDRIRCGAVDVISGLARKFESVTMSAARAVGFSRAENWFSCFFHPENAIDDGKTRHSLVRVLTDLLVVYAIYAVVNFITGGYFLYYSGAGNLVAFSGKYTIPDPAIFAASVLVLSPLFDILAWFVIVAVVFALAKLLGGKADFTLHAGALSRIFCGSSLILAAFSVPIFGFAALGMRLVDGYSLLGMALIPVSYTHLTLPTKRIV